MAHNPSWVVNKHPNNLKAQIKELVDYGYVVTLQDASTAQLVRKKSFSCLFALLTGVLPYALYYMAKKDYTVYLDLESQRPDPNGIKKEPSQTIFLLKGIGIIILALMTIGAFIGFIEGLSEKNGASQETITPIVDAPRMLTLTIDDARKELGTPIDGEQTEPTALQRSLGMDTWENTFEISGYSVTLEYNTESREVVNIFIATNDPTGATRDWKTLAQKAGIDEDATTYAVQPVQALNKSGYYTGVTAADK